MATDEKVDTDEVYGKFLAGLVKGMEGITAKEMCADDMIAAKVIKADSTLYAAFKSLQEIEVNSAPVVKEDGTFEGLLDLGSLLKYYMSQYKPQTMLDELKKYHEVSAVDEKGDKPQVNVTYLARMKKFHVFKNDATVLEVAQALATTPSVGINGDDGKLAFVVSQGHVIKFLSSKGLLNGATVLVDNVTMSSPVQSAKDTDAVVDCFALMAKNNRSNLAVVSEKDGFLGDINIRQLFQWESAENRENMKASDLVALRRPLSGAASTAGKDTLKDMLVKIIEKHTHRFYKVDDSSNLPSGVFSYTDFFKLVA